MYILLHFQLVGGSCGSRSFPLLSSLICPPAAVPGPEAGRLASTDAETSRERHHRETRARCLFTSAALYIYLAASLQPGNDIYRCTSRPLTWGTVGRTCEDLLRPLMNVLWMRLEEKKALMGIRSSGFPSKEARRSLFESSGAGAGSSTIGAAHLEDALVGGMALLALQGTRSDGRVEEDRCRLRRQERMLLGN